MSSRFFKTGNANRPYRAGGFVFEFEPLLYVSGTWVGALEEKKEERAEALAAFGAPVSEISEAEYTELKKKLSRNSHISEILEAKETAPTKTGEDAPVAVESLDDELNFRAPPAEDEVIAPPVNKKNKAPSKKAPSKKAPSKKAASKGANHTVRE